MNQCVWTVRGAVYYTVQCVQGAVYSTVVKQFRLKWLKGEVLVCEVCSLQCLKGADYGVWSVQFTVCEGCKLQCVKDAVYSV